MKPEHAVCKRILTPELFDRLEESFMEVVCQTTIYHNTQYKVPYKESIARVIDFMDRNGIEKMQSHYDGTTNYEKRSE